MSIKIKEAIIDFIFDESPKEKPSETVAKPPDIQMDSTITPEEKKLIIDALAHYCAICDMGFKTRGGYSSHKRFVHKLSTSYPQSQGA